MPEKGTDISNISIGIVSLIGIVSAFGSYLLKSINDKIKGSTREVDVRLLDAESEITQLRSDVQRIFSMIGKLDVESSVLSERINNLKEEHKKNHG